MSKRMRLERRLGRRDLVENDGAGSDARDGSGRGMWGEKGRPAREGGDGNRHVASRETEENEETVVCRVGGGVKAVYLLRKRTREINARHVGRAILAKPRTSNHAWYAALSISRTTASWSRPSPACSANRSRDSRAVIRERKTWS